MGITGGNGCNCKADKTNEDLFSRGKMKVLKKIKKRMGLAPRSGSSAANTNNVPPLLFHAVHGDNVRISRDGTVARRVESFCKGIAFSARPVKVNEKICIKFIEISNNWSGVIRFGFTYNDPSTLRHGLPKYACPDLTNKPGYWAKALGERFCSQNTILFYYVTPAGDVHFGINGEEKGIFFGGVETRGPLWALIDIYGNSTGIEFVDVRQELNNSRRNVASSSCDSSAEVDRLIVPMQSVNIHQRDDTDIPMLRYQNQPHNFSPFALHTMKGRNVRFNNNRSVASRVDTEFCQGYVFTGRPLHLGERVIIQILATEPMYAGALALGLTSCDPVSLQHGELPDDSDLLLDRPEYWVVSKDVASHPVHGDEISFSISHAGEVQISKNGSHPITVMHVDQTLKLWAFFDIYGSTQRIRVLSSLPQASPGRISAPERHFIIPASSESMNSLNSQSEIRRNMPNPVPVCLAPNELVHLQQNANGGAVLVVNLPSAQTNVLAQQNILPTTPQSHSHHSSQSSILSNHNQHIPHGPPNPSSQSHTQGVHHIPSVSMVHPPISAPIPKAMPIGTGTMMSTYSNTYIEPVSSSTYATISMRGDQAGSINGSGAECTICYEHPIDSVLYMCGHMCMCYECALQQWRGKGGGHCPLCRAVIRDVIRTYKS